MCALHLRTFNYMCSENIKNTQIKNKINNKNQNKNKITLNENKRGNSMVNSMRHTTWST